LRAYLREAGMRGVENIVALRGDPPKGQAEFQAVAGGFRYAADLVKLSHADFPQFGIAVAGYPETHQEAISPQVDLENLKRKVEAGADVVITQLFYVNDDFFRFRDACDRIGIGVPIVPGVLPVTNLAQIKRIASLCGAKLPTRFPTSLEACETDADAQFEIGVDFATEQVRQLIDSGIPGIHFYVLNKSPATSRVLRAVTRPA
jgi:methylenetetrahydrofolate reductase (NADPH)